MLTDEKVDRMVDSLLEGHDLIQHDNVECARIVLRTIIEEGKRDRDLLWVALPIARRCLGIGHKPEDAGWYARQTIAFSQANRKFVENAVTTQFKNASDPEAEAMAHLARLYFSDYSDRRVH